MRRRPERGREGPIIPFMGPSNPPHLHRRSGGWRVQTPADIFDQRARGTFIAQQAEARELLDFDQEALKLFRCSTAALDLQNSPLRTVIAAAQPSGG